MNETDVKKVVGILDRIPNHMGLHQSFGEFVREVEAAKNVNFTFEPIKKLAQELAQKFYDEHNFYCFICDNTNIVAVGGNNYTKKFVGNKMPTALDSINRNRFHAINFPFIDKQLFKKFTSFHVREVSVGNKAIGLIYIPCYARKNYISMDMTTPIVQAIYFELIKQLDKT